MLFLLLVLSWVVSLFAEVGDEQRDVFFKKYPNHYQDIYIEGEIFEVGSNICDRRYEYIKPVLETYNGPFSVLDLGACEGYFSFRIAGEFPAYCYMIEGGVYKDKPSKLLELCKLNKDLNVFLMQSRMNLDSLKDLALHDHFDVVFALLVVHQMAEQKHDLYKTHLEKAKEYIELILQLGNHVIIETSTNIYPELDTYVATLCKEKNGQYLGSLPRYKNNSNKNAKGRFYLFTAEHPIISPHPISDHSFKKLNGVFNSLVGIN